jgi:TPP-dependent pyruvate/acetoin dehydrogenase alpha subunit
MAHQCYGNHLDYTKGRQMPVHYSFRHLNIVSVSSPLMTQVPQAVGTAWAMKLRKDPYVTLTYFGEGSTSEGDFHVAMNFAGVYKTPAVFFLRNNGWAISTPASVQTASANFAMKANAYGFEGVQVDGNDVLAVIVATRRAVDKALRGEGPTLIEALTYRVGAHSTSDDPSGYRTEDHVTPWRSKDPVQRFQRFLAKRGLWTPEWEAELQERFKQEILEAIEIAEKTPGPAPETIFEDVYAEKPRFLQEQEAELMESLQRTKAEGAR